MHRRCHIAVADTTFRRAVPSRHLVGRKPGRVERALAAEVAAKLELSWDMPIEVKLLGFALGVCADGVGDSCRAIQDGSVARRPDGILPPSRDPAWNGVELCKRLTSTQVVLSFRLMAVVWRQNRGPLSDAKICPLITQP